MPFPVDEASIRKTETTLGVRLPPAYRKAMASMNGGAVHALEDIWELVPILNESTIKLLKRTFPGIARMTKDALEMPWFPRAGIVIAGNGTGDHLILLGNESGQLLDDVWHWQFHGGAVHHLSDSLDGLER